MTDTRSARTPIWFHWARTGVFTLLFAEYLRLVLMTDVAPHRVVVMAILSIISGVSLIALLRAIRQGSLTKT
jgi:hypothetical protein